MLSHCKASGHHRVATAQDPHPMLQQLARHSAGSNSAQVCRNLRAYASAAGQAPQQLDTTAAAVQQQDQQTRQQQLQQQWFQQSSVYYSNYPLDRAPEQRKDESQLLQWFNAPNTRVTPVMGSKILVSPATNNTTTASSSSSSSTGAKYIPVWVSPAAELGAALDSRVPPLFLGLDPSNKAPHFAVQVTKDSADSLASNHAAHWVAARSAGPDMSRSDAALMAVAAGLAQWNLDTQFHGASGAPTLPQAGGFARRCSASGRSVYPRIDPAIITLVTCGPDWCLLGRKADWPQGRYSTLAGFLEIGESLEQALCREVLEESGVAVDLHSTRYVTSQPWPFPRSLMVGFCAEAPPAAAAAAAAQAQAGGSAAGAQPTAGPAAAGIVGDMEWLSHQGRMAMMDTGLTMSEVSAAVSGLRLQQPAAQVDEMEDVRWFQRDWLRAQLRQGPAVVAAAATSSSALHDTFHIPGEYSLAYRLINNWLDSTPSSSSSSSDCQNGSSDAPISPSSSNGSSSSSWVGDRIPEVDIAQGVFKYVLMRLTDATNPSRSKLLVRGHPAAAYHNHILQHTKAEVSKLGAEALHVDVLGGGRIEHYPDQGVVSVYGYSAAFGPAVHEVAAGLLKKAYPFHTISWSYEGY